MEGPLSMRVATYTRTNWIIRSSTPPPQRVASGFGPDTWTTFCSSGRAWRRKRDLHWIHLMTTNLRWHSPLNLTENCSSRLTTTFYALLCVYRKTTFLEVSIHKTLDPQTTSNKSISGSWVRESKTKEIERIVAINGLNVNVWFFICRRSLWREFYSVLPLTLLPLPWGMIWIRGNGLGYRPLENLWKDWLLSFEDTTTDSRTLPSHYSWEP